MTTDTPRTDAFDVKTETLTHLDNQNPLNMHDKTDTPRTDAAEMPIDRVDTIASRPACVVHAEVARELERDLAVSRAESKTWHILYRDSRNETQKWKESWFDLDEERQKLKAEVKRLKGELDSLKPQA